MGTIPNSPAVVFLEKDNSAYAPNIESSVAGIVGYATKGPTNEATLITSQEQLLQVFGEPDESLLGQGLEGALEILETTNQLRYVRAIGDDAKEASASISFGICPAIKFQDNSYGVDNDLYLSITLKNNDGLTLLEDKRFAIPSGTAYSQAEALEKIINPIDRATTNLDYLSVVYDSDEIGKATGYLLGLAPGKNSEMTVSAFTDSSYSIVATSAYEKLTGGGAVEEYAADPGDINLFIVIGDDIAHGTGGVSANQLSGSFSSIRSASGFPDHGIFHYSSTYYNNIGIGFYPLILNPTATLNAGITNNPLMVKDGNNPIGLEFGLMKGIQDSLGYNPDGSREKAFLIKFTTPRGLTLTPHNRNFTVTTSEPNPYGDRQFEVSAILPYPASPFYYVTSSILLSGSYLSSSPFIADVHRTLPKRPGNVQDFGINTNELEIDFLLAAQYGIFNLLNAYAQSPEGIYLKSPRIRIGGIIICLGSNAPINDRFINNTDTNVFNYSQPSKSYLNSSFEDNWPGYISTLIANLRGLLQSYDNVQQVNIGGYKAPLVWVLPASSVDPQHNYYYNGYGGLKGARRIIAETVSSIPSCYVYDPLSVSSKWGSPFRLEPTVNTSSFLASEAGGIAIGSFYPNSHCAPDTLTNLRMGSDLWEILNNNGSLEDSSTDAISPDSNETVYGADINSNEFNYLVRSKYPGDGYNRVQDLNTGQSKGLSINIVSQGNSLGSSELSVINDGVNSENFKVSLYNSNNYFENVINTGTDNPTSEYIKGEIISASGFAYLPSYTSRFRDVANKGISISYQDILYVNANPRFIKPIQKTYSLANGTNGTMDSNATLIGNAASKTGIYALDDDTLNISLAAVPGIYDQRTQNALITLAETTQNFLAVVAPEYGLNTVEEAVDWMNGKGSRTAAINSSWAAVYWPHVQVFDVFSSKDRWYDPSIFAIRQMTYTDNISETWFAPAGFRRGRLTKPTATEVILNQGDRDVLYSNNINPVVNFNPEGITIFGQKTAQRATTALDRINVRRLMIYLRKVLLQTGRIDLFEPNDQFTWEIVQEKAEALLADIQARRGITDFRVVCDDTVNTPLRVDRNELWCKVLLKPTKTAEWIIFEVNLTNQSAKFNG